MSDVITVRFKPVSLFVIVTLAPEILALVLSVTKPVMAPVGTCALTILVVTSSNARTIRMACFMYSSAIRTSKIAQLPSQTNPTHQFFTTGVAAQRIEVGMHLYQLQNV